MNTVYIFEGCRFDVEARVVYARDGKPHPLKAKTHETLLYLVENPGRVIQRDEIMSAVWPDTVVEENNLTQHIASLRRLFGDTPTDHRFIETIAGRGYQFNAAVTRSDDGDRKSSDPPTRLARKRLIALAAGVVISLLLLLGVFYPREISGTDGPIKSIAVLPCKPIGEHDRNPSLQAGITHELISKLKSADGLSVSPYSAVRRFDSLEQDPVEAGRALKVEAVLECSIQIADPRVRVSAQLFRVADGKQIWAQPFREELADPLTIQELIAERVANTLKVKLSEHAKKRYTDNLAAYRQYQDGEYYRSLLTPEQLERGIDSYKLAIKIDPSYALAYAGLSNAYRSLILSSERPPSDLIDLSIAAAETAVRIDPQLAEAQAALGVTNYWFKRDWTASEAAFKRALGIDPNSSAARINYAHLLSTIGRHNEAITEAETAQKLDPSDAYICAVYGLVLLHAGKQEEALARFDEAAKLDPRPWLPPHFATQAYIDLGRYDDAIATARKAAELNPTQTNSWAYESFSMAKSGRRVEARKKLESMHERIKSQSYVAPYHIAIAYSGLGEREDALTWLEKAYMDRDPKMVFLRVDNFWDGLRSEPRFVDLMGKMKLEP